MTITAPFLRSDATEQLAMVAVSSNIGYYSYIFFSYSTLKDRRGR